MLKAASLAFLVLLTTMGTGNAQNLEADSLLRLVPAMQEDTNKVNLYWEIAAAIVYQNAPQAIPYFKQGIALATKLNYYRGLERCHTGVSLAFSFSGNPDSSLAYLDISIYYAHKVGDVNRLALVYLNKADAYCNLQRFGDALKYCDTAIKYAELSGNKDREGRIYIILNIVYNAQNQNDLAFASLDRSQACFEQVQNEQMVGLTLFNRALLYQKTNQLDKAVSSIKEAISIAKRVNDIQNLSSYTIVQAQVYHTQGKPNEAEALTRLSLQYAIETGHRKQQAVAYDMFYTLQMSRKNYPKAIEEELKAYAILKEEGDLLREKDVTGNLAEAYFRSGNSLQAYKYLQISKDLNDSLVKQQFNDETAKLQTSLHVAQKDKEIQLLNKDKELQRQKLQQQWLVIVASLIVAGFTLIGIGLLVNRYRLRQRVKELKLRNQIAADLHDEVGSSLSSIHMLSQVAAQQQAHNASQTDILSLVSTNARETMEKMGDIVWMIKPEEQEGASLVERMERFCYEMCSSQHIACTLEGTAQLQKLKLSMQQRKNLYLVFKEALNNAVKYSGTEKIDIAITAQNRHLSLTIKDYGKGFDRTAIVPGNGLDNMKNRAREMGGNLEIESMMLQGTTVRLTIDIPAL